MSFLLPHHCAVRLRLRKTDPEYRMDRRIRRFLCYLRSFPCSLSAYPPVHLSGGGMRNDPKIWQPVDTPNTAGSMPTMVQSEPWEQYPSFAALFRSISLSESCSEDQSDMLRPQYPSLYLTWSQSPFFSTSRQYYFQLSEISVHQGSFCNTLPSILHETILLLFRRFMDFLDQLRNRKSLPLSYTQPSACFFDISENSFSIH